MSGINIDQTEAREELAKSGNHFVWHVFAFATSDEERRLVIAILVGVLERKVAKVVERLAQDVKRNLKFYR